METNKNDSEMSLRSIPDEVDKNQYLNTDRRGRIDMGQSDEQQNLMRDGQNIEMEDIQIKRVDENHELNDKIEQIRSRKQGYNIIEHLVSIERIEMDYGTKLNKQDYSRSFGLSDEQIKQKRDEYGMNELTPTKQQSEWIKILYLFGSLFNILLLVCCGSAYISYGLDSSSYDNIYVGTVLLMIVIQDVVTNYIQEKKSSNLMAQFSKMMPTQSKVIRNGKQNLIPANQLVIGDLVKVTCGDKIPADIRLIQISGLKTELSALNGETEPVECVITSQNDDPIYSKNIIFNSCLIIEGEALGIVVRTGDSTFIGSIAKQTQGVSTQETTLQKEIKNVIKKVFVIGLTQAIIIFIIGVSKGMSVLNAVVNGFVLVLIANIPQGLPSTVSFSLNLIAKRMVKQNIFVKKLQTLETMGSSTLIASDKTGTLTQNKMTVENVWFDGQVFQSSFIFDKKNQFIQNDTFSFLFKVQALCNRAFFKLDEQEERESQENRKKSDNVDPLFHNSNFQNNENQGSFEDLQVNKRTNNILNQSSKNLMTSMKKNQSFKMKANQLQSESFMLKNRMKQGSFKEKKEMVERIRDIQNKELQLLAKQQKQNIDRREKEIVGDASETALMRYCDQILDIEEYRMMNPKIFEIPFNSKNKWQLSIHQIVDKRICVLKGAPEIILHKCHYHRLNGELKEIDEQFTDQFQKAYEGFARQGQRVLGFAYIDLGNDNTVYDQSEENYPSDKFIFCGLASLIDPPKVGVDESIRRCKIAGIKVFMVTGDHPLTAEAIARKIGIISSYQTREEIAKQRGVGIEQVNPIEAQAAVIYGPDMIHYNQDQWDDLVLKQEIVFARISPQQKVEIVQQFQDIGEIVAVTGDGVNDAIALKKSDIGIAMGDGGSAVAKDAADVLFMDDNFGSILQGIEQGRLLFDNLKKAIAYIMSHLWPELLPLMMNFMFGMPLGLSAIQLLSIDLFTELAPAIALSYEEKEDRLMERPPRNQNTDKLFSKQVIIYSYAQAALIECLFSFLAYANVFWRYNISLSEITGTSDKYWKQSSPNIILGGVVYDYNQQIKLQQEAATTYYVTLVMSQFVHLWVCRTRTSSIFSHGFNNILAIFGCIIELLLLCFFIYTPSIQSILSSYPVGWTSWLMWIPSGFTLILWAETRKYYGRKNQQSCFNHYLNY